MADNTTNIINRVLESGENTSEHAVMASATSAGRVYAGLGLLLAGIPQVLDYLSTSPIKDTKWGGIVLSVLGGIIAILGIVKETKAKVEYISGRSILKSAAIRDLDVKPASPAAVPPPEI